MTRSESLLGRAWGRAPFTSTGPASFLSHGVEALDSQSANNSEVLMESASSTYADADSGGHLLIISTTSLPRQFFTFDRATFLSAGPGRVTEEQQEGYPKRAPTDARAAGKGSLRPSFLRFSNVVADS